MNIAIKPTYLLLIPVIALASCSQDDMPGGTDGDDGKRIVFRTSLPGLTSRAEIITEDNLPNFYVTAFDLADQTLMSGGVMEPLFANEKIDIVGSKNAYTSSRCCWPDQPKESHVVSFFGFYPGLEELEGAQLDNASTGSAVDYKLTGVRVVKDIADQFDFVTAYTSGSMADNLFSGVTLPFAHQLSRIEVKAYGAHKSCDIEIAGVRIGGTGVEDTFDFQPIDGAGVWSGNPTRGIVEYVYRKGDKIVTCGKSHRVDLDDAVSIMGARRADGNDNCAMLIPATYTQWNYAGDRRNAENKMYISVLIRVIDATLTAGKDPVETQRYPYRDLSQGIDALKIPVVYLAVNKVSGEVSTRLYKNGSSYFTDAAFKDPYSLPATEEVKEFGWAALPVEGTWAPGNIYTYSLNYTHGVGVHDPEVSTTTAPRAGDPVISDRVGMTYTVKEWKVGGSDKFEVPGS